MPTVSTNKQTQDRNIIDTSLFFLWQPQLQLSEIHNIAAKQVKKIQTQKLNTGIISGPENIKKKKRLNYSPTGQNLDGEITSLVHNS